MKKILNFSAHRGKKYLLNLKLNIELLYDLIRKKEIFLTHAKIQISGTTSKIDFYNAHPIFFFFIDEVVHS